MFNRVPKEEQTRPTLSCGPGRTVQSEKDTSDINLIMAKYRRTGMVNFVNRNQGEYMDATSVDFQQALNIIANANEMFSQMPSDMRKKFDNSPEKFLEFVHDPEKLEESYKLGIRVRPDGYVEPAPVEPETPEA